jgi:hypothetical protein
MSSIQTLELAHVTVHGTLSTPIAKTIKPIGSIPSLRLVRLLSQDDLDIAACTLALMAFLKQFLLGIIACISYQGGE